jgi:hypothetical protein
VATLTRKRLKRINGIVREVTFGSFANSTHRMIPVRMQINTGKHKGETR